MNVEIALRLASRRRDAGFSQEALAEKLGVTRQAVSKWERSESSPDTDNLIALARLYGVSLDELLNIDPTLEDDIAFETADRATQNRTTAQVQTQAESTLCATASRTTDTPEGPHNNPDKDDAFVDTTIVASDKDYVKINWRNGVHVRDAKTGEEVHVGWNGIDIKSGKEATGACGASKRTDSEGTQESTIHEHWGKDGKITLDGEPIDHKSFAFSAGHRFPFFLLVLIGYICLGLFGAPLSTSREVASSAGISPWAYGLFLFALVPVYHMIVHAVQQRSIVRLLQGFYPFACVVFFLWMWLIMGQPHPAWVAFLTIPLVEWACEAIRRRMRRRMNATR